MDMCEKFALEKYFSSEEIKKPKSLPEARESPKANVSLNWKTHFLWLADMLWSEHYSNTEARVTVW